MKIAIISGSHRKTANSLKLAKFIEKKLKTFKEVSDVYLLDMSKSPLPLWDDLMWEDKPNHMKKTWQPISDALAASDGFVVVSPEWNGMVPSGLKNLFLYASIKEFGNKPAAIVTVSSGMGGCYPVAELRQSSYKNNRLCYIPDHLIVRHADDLFNDYDHPDSDDEKLLRERLQQNLAMLLSYARALQKVREESPFHYEQFPHGM